MQARSRMLWAEEPKIGQSKHKVSRMTGSLQAIPTYALFGEATETPLGYGSIANRFPSAAHCSTGRSRSTGIRATSFKFCP